MVQIHPAVPVDADNASIVNRGAHRIVLDRGDKYRSPSAPQRQVIGFRAAAGKDDFSRSCIERGGDGLARVFDRTPGQPPEAMDR